MQAHQLSTTVASLAGYPLYEAIDKVHELGFSSITFLAARGARHSVGDLAGFWFDELSRSERARLREAVAPFTATSVHAPFQDAPLLSYSPRVVSTSERLVRTGMEAAAFLGARVATIHVNSRPMRDLDEDWVELLQRLRALGDYGALLGVHVGIETGYPRDVATYLRLIEETDHPMVGATLDVGHVAFMMDKALWSTTAGVTLLNDNIHVLCEQLGSKLLHMHLHDVRKEDWRDHRMVGGGVINWRELVACLESRDYSWLLEFELEEHDRETALALSRSRLLELM